MTFHDASSSRRDHTGLFRHGNPREVHLCVSGHRVDTVRKLITLHELGHAWAETRTSDETRVDSWVNHHQPPHLWGAEHAAETISWALMDMPVRIVRINDAAPERLDAAFRVLTGSAPLLDWEI